MSTRVRLSDLSNMGADAQARHLDALVAATAKPRAGAAVSDARIRGFEVRYEMGSDEMRSRLGTGELRETAEIAQWLFLLGSRERLAAG